MINLSPKLQLNLAKAYIIYVIAFSVLVDLVNGYLLLNNGNSLIGVGHKSSVIILSMIYLLIVKPFKFITILSFIFVILFSFLLLSTISEGGLNMIEDFKIYIRVIYPLFIVLTLIDCLKNKKELEPTFLKALYFYGVIAAAAILLNVFTGIGTQTYGDYAFGFQSYFYAANEIGLSLVVIATFMFSQSLKNGVIHYRLLILALIIGGSTFFIGSVTSMTGILLGFFFVAILALSIIKSRLLSFRLFKRLGLFILFSFSIFAFYAVSTVLERYPYVAGKIERIVTGESSRDLLGNAANQYLYEKDSYDLLVGVGYTQHTKDYSGYYSKKNEGKAIVERDPYDVIGVFGVVLGLVILFGYYSIPLLIIIYSRLKLSFDVIVALYLMTFVIGHSYYAGHVIFSPMVNTFYFLMAVFAFMQVKTQRSSTCFSTVKNT